MKFGNIWAVYWEALCVLPVIWQFQAVIMNLFSYLALLKVTYKKKSQLAILIINIFYSFGQPYNPSFYKVTFELTSHFSPALEKDYYYLITVLAPIALT